jgi:hypothetical protein
MVLLDYMARMDGDDPQRALECLEPDFRFLLALPGGDVTGASREDFARYIAGRAAVRRVHNILRSTVDGDFETVYGIVTESGRSYFTTSFELIDWSPAGTGAAA